MQLQVIENKIHELRGQKVMLDFDLAELYHVETRILKQAVNRNKKRFPPDFMFQLRRTEFETLRSQIVISKSGGTRYLPYAFTEQGVAMLSSVLKSKKALHVNVAIMRTFVFMRQYALSHKDLTFRLKELENRYNKQFKDVYQVIQYLLDKDEQVTLQKERREIGFKR